MLFKMSSQWGSGSGADPMSILAASAWHASSKPSMCVAPPCVACPAALTAWQPAALPCGTLAVVALSRALAPSRNCAWHQPARHAELALVFTRGSKVALVFLNGISTAMMILGPSCWWLILLLIIPPWFCAQLTVLIVRDFALLYAVCKPDVDTLMTVEHDSSVM